MLRAISYVLTFSGGAVFGIAFLCLLQAGKKNTMQFVQITRNVTDMIPEAMRKKMPLTKNLMNIIKLRKKMHLVMRLKALKKAPKN